MPGDRDTGGGLLLGYFFLATQEEVTRSPAGRVEALHLNRGAKSKELDYARLLPRTLWAIRCANVRYGILPPQSGLRRNDERRATRDQRRKKPPEGGFFRQRRGGPDQAICDAAKSQLTRFQNASTYFGRALR